MRIPKRYGEGKLETCPFCGRQCLVQNEQGVPVCKDHKDTPLPEMKCVCGEFLFLQKGKFGVFFNCMNCGNVSLRKALDVNNVLKPHASKNASRPPGHMIIRSDDPYLFD